MTKKEKQVEDKSTHTQFRETGQDLPEDGIGSRLRAAREMRGWSQSYVSDMSKELDIGRKGVHRTVLVGYEAGHSRPGAREIRILCETLSITPNWLIYGSEFAGGSEHKAMEAARKNGLYSAMRMALAIAVLKPHERNAFQSLVLSMAGRELGDRKLSRLFMIAVAFANPGFEQLKETIGDDELMSRDIHEVLEKMLEMEGFGGDVQWGNNLDFGEKGTGPITGEWLYPEPKK
nr:helix-turn-helix transcriptional regulator [uncultured Undibacterium sp.]